MRAMTMDESAPPPEVRPAKRVRLVEHSKGISVYPEPYHVPVLPNGWAPLDRSDQDAVLNACDTHPHACRLRLGSPWDPATEYRVYLLDADAWHGVCTATVFSTAPPGASRDDRPGCNTRLLAIARDVPSAVRVAIDFLNWDLEAEGAHWRLTLSPSEPRSHHS